MEKKYRDGLFRNYFSDKKRLLGLCNLLTGEDATDPDEIEINTLDTINENMPLRILFYAAELLRQYVDERKKKIYLEKLIPLPQPQFFVFYNGRKKEAEHREMRLSDAFGGYTCLEVVVQMYNISAGMNEDLILHDESLNNYCIFLNLYHKFLSEGMDSAHALKAAFDYCISHGIMVEYLLSIKKELASMLALEYDPELDHQAWFEEGLKEGQKQGRSEGHAEGKIEMVKNLLLAETPLKYIVAATGWTEEQILKVADNNP